MSLPISIPTSNLNCEYRATVCAKNRGIIIGVAVLIPIHFSGIVIAPWRQRETRPSSLDATAPRSTSFCSRLALSRLVGNIRLRNDVYVCGTCTPRVARACRSWSVTYLRVRALSHSTLMPASATDSAASRYATRYSFAILQFRSASGVIRRYDTAARSLRMHALRTRGNSTARHARRTSKFVLSSRVDSTPRR